MTMAMLRFLLMQLISSLACIASVTAFSSSHTFCRSSSSGGGGGGVRGALVAAATPILSEDDVVVPNTNSSIPTTIDTDAEDQFYYDHVVRAARDDLVALSHRLTTSSSRKSGSGENVFIRRPSDAIRLVREIDRLETIVAASSNRNEENSFQRRRRMKELLVGDWTLIATAYVPSSRFRGSVTNDNNKLNDSSERNSKGSHWFNDFQATPSIDVTQRIRCTASEKGETQDEYDDDDGSTTATTTEIDRVDNVIEISPPTTDESNILFRLLNPLSISKTKLVLIHNANIESVHPVLRTKIAWVSTVLNVAGSSSTTTSSSSVSSNNQFFDANGQDLLGINNLFGEFINVGSFDTPYVDERVRVSRSPGPVFETVRVFVRKEDA